MYITGRLWKKTIYKNCWNDFTTPKITTRRKFCAWRKEVSQYGQLLLHTSLVVAEWDTLLNMLWIFIWNWRRIHCTTANAQLSVTTFFTNTAYYIHKAIPNSRKTKFKFLYLHSIYTAKTSNTQYWIKHTQLL